MQQTVSVNESFRTDGFYLAKGILPADLVETTLTQLNTLVVQQVRRLGGTITDGPVDTAVAANLKALFDLDIKAYLASLTLSAKLFSVHAMVMHENVARLMRELGVELPAFQTSPVLHIMSNQLQIPGGYSGIGVHQDWPALQGPLDTVTIWIPLADVGRDFFPLEVIKGSHLRGLRPGNPEANIYEIDPSQYDESDFMSLDTERGDALFFSSFLVHRSGQVGKGNGVRLSISARYENCTEPTFIERNYPFAQKRSVQRDFITPDFPAEAQVREIYEDGPQSR